MRQSIPRGLNVLDLLILAMLRLFCRHAAGGPPIVLARSNLQNVPTFPPFCPTASWPLLPLSR
jgi:hypothetical protein